MVLWLVLFGVINAPLAPLATCQHDLIGDGKAVREASQAEIPSACKGSPRVLLDEGSLGAKKNLCRLSCHFNQLPALESGKQMAYG